jgi:transposase
MDGGREGSIVAESFEKGANISEVARRHGVVRGLLTVWRHKFAATTGLQAPAVPVRFTSESGLATAEEPDRLAPAKLASGEHRGEFTRAI